MIVVTSDTTIESRVNCSLGTQTGFRFLFYAAEKNIFQWREAKVPYAPTESGVVSLTVFLPLVILVLYR